jgi:uncharacterized BrkB/YihY/UPF0761 family membrane protein
MYSGAFRVLTPKVVQAGKLLPGAVGGGAAWTALQTPGTYLVDHLLHTDSVYGVFATVLAWIYLAAEIAVYAAETNVALARQPWPRSIVQPTLTPADRAVLAGQALQNQRRDDQQVSRCPLTTRHPAHRHPENRCRPRRGLLSRPLPRRRPTS